MTDSDAEYRAWLAEQFKKPNKNELLLDAMELEAELLDKLGRHQEAGYVRRLAEETAAAR